MSIQTLDQATQSAGEPAVLTNPFPGLRPFQFEESHLFFGRDGQSERLIAKLAARRFLAIVGTSGSGKSSLVRAGLLPALYSGFMSSAGSAWRIAIMRPGNDPLGNLARALNEPDVFGSEDEANRALQINFTEASLRRGSLGLVEAVRHQQMPGTENLLVVADQFEELFRVEQGAQSFSHAGEQENDRAAFVKLLLEARQQREEGLNIYVVLTMRSDYLGDCAQFWDLPEAINESQYLIPRLTREQIREAITGPIFVGGAEATPRLINRLLNDVDDNPDQLPILQHALMRTWDEWQVKNPAHSSMHEGNEFDICCYEAIGDMNEALSRHADEAYNELNDEQKRIAEKMFKLLTGKSSDNRKSRRPVVIAEIGLVAEADKDDVIAVIEKFRQPSRSFLTTTSKVLKSESIVDISHESLIRGWHRLADWIEEEAQSARFYIRLAETAALHQEGKARLWRDPDLQNNLEWWGRYKPNRTWAKRYHMGFDLAKKFLEKSRESYKFPRIMNQIVEVLLSISFLSRVVALLGLESYGKALLTRRAELTMKAIGMMLAVNLFFDLGAWGLLFNAVFGGGRGSFEIGWHTPFALFAAVLISLPILIYEQQFMTADLSSGRRQLIVPVGLRLLVILVAAFITTQPVELMFFKGPIERRVHDEGVRLEAISRLRDWEKAKGIQSGKEMPEAYTIRQQKTADALNAEKIRLTTLEDQRSRAIKNQASALNNARYWDGRAATEKDSQTRTTFRQNASNSRRRAEDHRQEADRLSMEIQQQTGRITEAQGEATDARRKVDYEIEKGQALEKQVTDWLSEIRTQQPRTRFADPSRFGTWQYENRSYDFFEQLRVLSDLREGRPARWPEASEKDRQLLAEVFKFKEREAESEEAKIDQTYYTRAYWAVFGIAFVIPTLLLAFKLLQPKELRDYYSRQWQDKAQLELFGGETAMNLVYASMGEDLARKRNERGRK